MEYLDKLLDKAIWPVAMFLGGVVAKLFKQSQALKNINVAVARKDIIGIYEKARDRSYTTLYEHEAMMDLLKNYYALGGNGTIHHIEQLYLQIPIDTNPLDKEIEKIKPLS